MQESQTDSSSGMAAGEASLNAKDGYVKGSY